MRNTEYLFKKRRRGRKRLRRLLPAAVLIAMVAAGAGGLIAYLARSHSVKQTNAALQEIYEQSPATIAEATASPGILPEPAGEARLLEQSHEAAGEMRLLAQYHDLTGEALPQMQELYEKNGDFAAWLRIPGVVSLPVVYRDNTFYLDHDFNGKSSAAGTLFLDEKHPLTEQTQYLVVHGHNMRDGSMFGLLSHYRGLDYVLQHGLATLTTRYREEKYALFAVLIVSEDPGDADYAPYTGMPVFQSEGQFQAFVDSLRKRSLYEIPIDVAPGDALLALSTCLDEEKLALVFRRARDGETEENLLQTIYLSTWK